MADQRDPERDQQAPVPQGMDVQQALIRAIQERRQHGIRKYGQPLMTEDGRDTLRDAWEEALDLCSYLTKALLQRDGRLPIDPEQPPVVREGTEDYNDLQTWLEGDSRTAMAAARRLDQRQVDRGQMSPRAFKAAHDELPALTVAAHRNWCPEYQQHVRECCPHWGTL